MRSRWPEYSAEEIAAVERVLRSGRVNYWTGTEGRAFETEFADYLGVRHAVAVANGTVALELALRSLGIGAGDHVVVPARTFVATATAVVAVGARPVVADVDRDSGVVTIDTLAMALTPETRAVIVVHLGGWPCDMDAITEWAEGNGLAVIEDCAQAHGATIGGRAVGTFGHASAYSFCTDKIMSTCGEGGMLVTNDEALWRTAWEYKDHGRDLDALDRAAEQGGHEFKWLIGSFGTNWRMTEVQAAVGRIQLRMLDEWVARRRENASVLAEALADVPGVRVPVVPPRFGHACYKSYAYLDPRALAPGWHRGRVLDAVNALGVPLTQGSCPEIYLERAFTERGWGPAERLAVARELGETSMMLPVDHTLTSADMREAAAALGQVMREATGRREAAR